MAITTQLIGALGSRGYLFATTGPKTYVLPPNPDGWSILITRYSSTGNLSFKCTNRITGATVWEYNANQPSVSSRTPAPELAEATRVGMNIEIRNSTETRICVSSGIDKTPPTA